MSQHKPRPRPGFSLIELLTVIVLVSIAAAVVVPNLAPAMDEKLRGVAQIAASDLEYTRSLAVSYNSTYRMSFNASSDTLTVEHTGADTTLDALPPSPYRSPTDPADKQITRLAELPGIDISVEIAAVYTAGSAPQTTHEIEFGPLGETTSTEETRIWLAAGSGNTRRFIRLSVNPVTGLIAIGDIETSLPAEVPGTSGNESSENESQSGGTSNPT